MVSELSTLRNLHFPVKLWRRLPTGLQPIFHGRIAIIHVKDVTLLLMQQEVPRFVSLTVFFGHL